MGSKETDEKRDDEGSSDEPSAWGAACPLGPEVWGAVSRGPQSTVSIEEEKPKAAGPLGGRDLSLETALFRLTT